MESRFRVKFWTSRRAKRNSELEIHSVPYQAASEGKRRPIFIHQPLGRNLKEKRKSDTSALQGVSYRTSRAGTPPEIGDLPHKGNGPIKLHASRSGELLSSESVLAGIEDADIFVPRRDSRTLSLRNSTLNERRPSHSSLSSSPSQRRPPGSAPAAWAPFSGSSPLLDIPENSPTHLTTRHSMSTPQSSGFADSMGRPTSHQQNSPIDGLGIFEQPPQGILKNGSQHVEAPAEQSATIRALWKAEYSRLVTIYGQAGVEKSFGEMPGDQKKLSIIEDEQVTPVALDPLPRPSFEPKDNKQKTRRRSRSDARHDDTSDESSQRPHSFMSSAGGYASSFTTRTSIAESDTFTTKDDIRKMVDARAREPSRDAVKSLRRKKKRKSTTPATTPRASSIPVTPEGERSVSMPTTSSSPLLRSQRSVRTVSQPVAGIPLVQDPTASDEPEPDAGLKRADSATLGALTGESRRSSIKKRAASRQNSRRGSLSNPKIRLSTSVSKKASPAEKENVVEDEDFASLYKDIFSSTDFWQSSATASTTNISLSTYQTPDSVSSGPNASL
ncbi:uncharacterized protein AB675_8044 [Cyphellophora attinorum]|uniref:Uncharacterized protein n=1 Tax=Cyphellophora attinorum TaxID=1664694 RepID=A0A0N1H5M6_9EURO|nr:uncharacterized protein AB675_8044 [Phialophora attinorum]KPI41093.1 hypothetical protein AB675_8044 [Phialophora attinorum]